MIKQEAMFINTEFKPSMAQDIVLGPDLLSLRLPINCCHYLCCLYHVTEQGQGYLKIQIQIVIM
jgi:hypothetical protein